MLQVWIQNLYINEHMQGKVHSVSHSSQHVFHVFLIFAMSFSTENAHRQKMLQSQYILVFESKSMQLVCFNTIIVNISLTRIAARSISIRIFPQLLLLGVRIQQSSSYVDFNRKKNVFDAVNYSFDFSLLPQQRRACTSLVGCTAVFLFELLL